MDGSAPSGTAIATAYARAYHQIVDTPLILTDPVVGPLLGVAADDLAAQGERGVGPGGSAMTRPRRMFFAARARCAEDAVAEAYANGMRQVVILGAGLDTFGYRNPHQDLYVYEVDHPATQEWKRRRLAEAAVDVPDTVTFVPVDFENDSLADRLDTAGVRSGDPIVFVWLGVVYYLTRAAIDATLDHISTRARSTEIVFDYLQPGDSAADQAQLRHRAGRVASVGEPWLSLLTPAEVRAMLQLRGFGDIVDRSADDVIVEHIGATNDFGPGESDILRASRIVRARRS